MEEIPAYLPSGNGSHHYVLVQKTELTTFACVREIAQHTQINERDIGVAGLKDKMAVTTQWFSLPENAHSQTLLEWDHPNIKVLEMSRHSNKLKTGHLLGNRFTIGLENFAVPLDEALETIQGVIDVLSRSPGMPNLYGPQRFGRHKDNHIAGLEILRGTKRKLPGKTKRLLISATQSYLFNEYVNLRYQDYWSTVLEGDVLQTPKGGKFVSEDPQTDTIRLQQGEVFITGPMFGGKMRPRPAAQSPSAALEEKLLEISNIQPSDFEGQKLSQGARRPIAIPLQNASARMEKETNRIWVTFELPAGSYASIVIEEITKDREKLPALPVL